MNLHIFIDNYEDSFLNMLKSTYLGGELCFITGHSSNKEIVVSPHRGADPYLIYELLTSKGMNITRMSLINTAYDMDNELLDESIETLNSKYKGSNFDIYVSVLGDIKIRDIAQEHASILFKVSYFAGTVRVDAHEESHVYRVNLLRSLEDNSKNIEEIVLFEKGRES